MTGAMEYQGSSALAKRHDSKRNLEDFNDWGSDPGGVAKAASLCLTLQLGGAKEVAS